MRSPDDEAESQERLGEALDSMALLLVQNIRALAAPPAYSPFAQAVKREADSLTPDEPAA